ncbi:hypothetical protein [Kribbella sp. VKM Ac-2568]|uniref:hypothetical protein n=1 Tax=Kribbella sp. VKM Ac-2568 TaxID=2512219 RepID=UPI001F543598|nr:hypothetical protein [Kribbella sp. VKM Ac-2568]
MVDVTIGLRTVFAAPTEFGVEGIHYAGVEGADLLLAEERPDVFLGVAAVHVQGVELEVCFVEVAIEQLVDRGLRPGVAPLVQLVEQVDLCLVRQLLGVRADRDRLRQVVPTFGNGVDACVYAHSEGAAG